MKKQIISLLTVTTLIFSSFTVNVQAQNKERVTFGIDLTDAQEEQMLKEFGVTTDKVSIDRITNDDIIKQLGLDPNDQSNYQGGCYSSSYVKLTNEGGINVQANNLTEVTGLMLSNALVTSGVTNADVKASSPFPVTGTSALSGILKGFEAIKGEELSLKNKKVAQEEVETTANLGEEIGFDEAAAVINDVKTEIIKEAPKSEAEVEKIVNKVTKDYTIDITDEQKSNITNLMVQVNDLNIDYSEVKETLSNISDKISNALETAGKELSNSGFFQNIWNNISDFFSNIVDWFKSLFTGDSSNSTETVTPEKDNTSENISDTNNSTSEEGSINPNEDTDSKPNIDENNTENTSSTEDTSNSSDSNNNLDTNTSEKTTN
ncbi:DUF1002 domain-containing protein [Clostridium sp.]|uniref:DUF1002 domain-containing protein n=1 Tax=Clostridium sp. TaxID=1506 RepID=UPI003F2DB2F5